MRYGGSMDITLKEGGDKPVVAVHSRAEPDVCTYVDQQANSLTVEIVLPGVPKENIKLRLSSRCLLLHANADNVVYSKYLPFHYPVDADKTKAVFERDLLRIKVPLRM